MDENISRAAGAAHGQLATPEDLENAIRATGRIPARRNTLYALLEMESVAEAPAATRTAGAPRARGR